MNQSALRHAFHPLAVTRVVDETPDARLIVFAIPPALRDLFAYEAGQFLTLEVPSGAATLRRSYSLASSPHWDAEHKVTVKRVAGGRVSNWVNDQVRAGSVLAVQPPEGRFVLSKRDLPIVLFAGGSGITPVISLIKTALKTTRRAMTLVYANRDETSIIFRRELDVLVHDFADRLRVVHRLDAQHGFVKPADVRALAPEVAKSEHYLCGPTPFMDTVERGLRDAGALPELLHIERFASLADAPIAPKPAAPAATGSQIPEVIQVELRGEKRAVRYEKGKTILRAAIDGGFDAPYSCEEGFCGCCAAQLVEGQVTMDADDALTAEEKKRGVILTCQSRPTTARCAVEYLDT